MSTRPQRPRPSARVLGAAMLVAALIAQAAPATATSPRPGRDRSGSHEPTGRVVMRFDPDADAASHARALARAGVRPGQVDTRRHGLCVVTPAPGETPAETAGRLADQPGVLYAAPEGRVKALAVPVPPDDPEYSRADGQQVYLGSNVTNLFSVDLEPAWSRAFNAADHTLVADRPGVTLALIDTGVSMPYAETTGEFVPVWDYIGRDADTSDESGNSHGTRVASILRAKTSNGRGIAGALHSSENRILVYRVLDANGFGDTADLLDAICDAADRGAKVINCSLGESLYDSSGNEVAGLRDSYEQAVAYAWARGAVIVAAAGNENTRVTPWTHAYAPACIDAVAGAEEVIAVGSIDPATGLLSAFSNYGPGDEIDLVAGGEGIWSVDRAGTPSTGNGTSYATPVVAGSLALLMSAAPSAHPSVAIAALLGSGATYPVRDTQSGYGLPDIDAAYAAMISGLPEQPAVTVTAGTPGGRAVALSWGAANGQGVTYRYGEVGGRTYSTTARTAQVVLSSEGTRTLWVRPYATDRWSHQTTLTAQVTVAADGLGPLAATRLEGTTRYRTASAVSRDMFPAAAAAVVVASGANWPDALAAAPLAAVLGGPLLLTEPSSLSIETRDEILRLRPSHILVVGGTGAVSATVANQLASLQPTDTVTRVAGFDRYETAALVAGRVSAEQGGVPGRLAFVCSGEHFADALSGAAAAGAAGQPVLLTPSRTLAPATSQALSALGIVDTVVLGGTGAISAPVLQALPSPERVAGVDRYATSRAVADWAVAKGILAFGHTGTARGDSFPDALAAGARMAAAGGPLVLAPTSFDGALASWLGTRGPQVDDVTFFGGSAAVTYGLENGIRLALRGQ